jgi:hypothetical protein
VYVEFAIQRLDVRADGAANNAKLVSNLRAVVPGGRQAQDLRFPSG